MPEQESGIDPNININIDRDKWNDAQVLTQVAVSVKGNDIPDALAITNPDGTPQNVSQGQYFLDETIQPLTLNYVKVDLGFKAKYLEVVNLGTGNRIVWISFNGTDTHVKLTAGESFTWEAFGKTYFYIKYSGDDAPDYRLFAY